MKIKLMDRAGNLLRSLTTEGGGQLMRAPDAVVIPAGEATATFLLSQRDDPDGAQVYMQAASVLVLDR